MNRKPMLAANWKMNHGIENSIKFLTEFMRGLPTNQLDVDIVICPPYTSLYTFSVALQDDEVILLGAQNCHHEDAGAFTGEISLEFLHELHCDYVIVGHSERRQYFFETDELINKKLLKTFEKDLLPIFCIGESEVEREAGKTFEVLSRQLQKGLMN